MSEFFLKVYKIVEKIPSGHVATYGQIATLLGSPRASRVVGEAMRRTPEYLEIPCHRVVNQKGEMAPGYAFGDKGKQRELLEQEGIEFLNNGCIDMKKHIWKGSV